MKVPQILLTIVTILAVVGLPTATAQTRTDELGNLDEQVLPQVKVLQTPSVQPVIERGRFGVGYVAAYPTPLIGLNLSANLVADISAEVFVAPLGPLSAYGVKGKYTFAKEPGLLAYGFGVAMLYSSLNYDEKGELGSLESSFGGGAGIEIPPPFSFSRNNGSITPLMSFEIGLLSQGPFSSGVSLVVSSGLTLYF